MHEILLPKSRIQRIRNSYRHPDQAALLARLPIAGRRVPFRSIWRRQRVDPRRMIDHGAVSAGAGLAAVKKRLPAVGAHLPAVREHAAELRAQMPERAAAIRGRVPGLRARVLGVRDQFPLVRERAAAAAHSTPVQRARGAAVAATQGTSHVALASARKAQVIAARAPRGRMTAILASFALGALLVYFFDRHSGRRRRALVRDKFVHARRVVRRDLPRKVQKRTRFLGGIARGVGHNAADLVPNHLRRAHVDDDTLVARVRSEALRGDGIRPGEIHVDAYEGCVTLRGQLDREADIAAVVRATGRIDGVLEVRSYLHLPGTYPPNKAASLVNGHSP